LHCKVLLAVQHALLQHAPELAGSHGSRSERHVGAAVVLVVVVEVVVGATQVPCAHWPEQQ
jgi:hypothetical protein